MSTLTRRRFAEAQVETWHIYFGDVQAGIIARRTGNPSDTAAWQWSCGFYPGSRPGEQTIGTSDNFAEARAAFEAAWTIFLTNRSADDFACWRRHHAFTAWKYTMWDAGCRLPTQNTSGRSRCFCGAEIELATVESHIYSVHMAALEA
ncbi:hypothetical protein ACQR13_21120 [Bradyrhizobium sp. HKCCYLRH3059]|uniref:hypothetical protein n=1 Tax=Bradyrhizobium sp. HKCCYLRH3059 TaxID=3420745 RepID=UPI003EBF0D52